MFELGLGFGPVILNQPITVVCSTPRNASSVGTPFSFQTPAFQSSLPATVGLTCWVWIELLLPGKAPSSTRICLTPLTRLNSVSDEPWSISIESCWSTGNGCSKS